MIYHRHIIITKGMEQTHKCFSRYNPVIYDRWSYVGYILGIYQVYTFELEYAIYILGIFHVYSLELEYTRYIPGIFLYIVIYQVYTRYIFKFDLVYARYTPYIFFLNCHIPGICLVYTF